MAEYLTLTARRLTRCCPALSMPFMLLAPCFFAHAQELVDPTRPPASVQAGAGAAAATPVPAEPVLQSVLISPRRKEAIISGQVVKSGEKFGDAQVVRITANEVVLRNGQHLQTLKLFPNVEKRPASGRANVQPDAR